MARLRIVFMGTPDLAATCLTALLDTPNFEIAAAVSQPDRPKGRHLQLQPTPVKSVALQAGIPVFQPDRASEADFLEQLRGLSPDLIAVAAYGQILPKALLELPPHGCLNVHTSLLPRYRGAAPIQWALLNGDAETGVTIMKIAPELDTGDILSQATTRITAEDNSITLHDRLAGMGAELLVSTITQYVSGEIQAAAQPAQGVVYARKITKSDGLVDWSRPAEAIWNQVRGLVPWPTAHTHLDVSPASLLVKIWSAHTDGKTGEPGMVIEASDDGILVGCGSGSLRILELQLEGKRRMTARDFLAGHPLESGRRFIRG